MSQIANFRRLHFNNNIMRTPEEVKERIGTGLWQVLLEQPLLVVTLVTGLILLLILPKDWLNKGK